MMIECLADFLDAAALYEAPHVDEWGRWCLAMVPEQGGGTMSADAATIVRAVTEDIACGSLEPATYYRDLIDLSEWRWARFFRNELRVPFRTLASRIRCSLARWLAVDRHYTARAAMAAAGYSLQTNNGRAQSAIYRAPYAIPPGRIQRWLPE